MLSRIVSTIDTIWTVSLSTIFCSSTTFIWYTHNTVQISTWQERKLNWLKLLYIWMNSKLNNFNMVMAYLAFWSRAAIFCIRRVRVSSITIDHRNWIETFQKFFNVFLVTLKSSKRIKYIPAFVGLILTCRRWTCIKEYSYISSIADYDQQHKRHFKRDNNFLFVENWNSRMTKFYNFLLYIIVWKWFDIHCNIYNLKFLEAEVLILAL